MVLLINLCQEAVMKQLIDMNFTMNIAKHPPYTEHTSKYHIILS